MQEKGNAAAFPWLAGRQTSGTPGVRLGCAPTVALAIRSQRRAGWRAPLARNGTPWQRAGSEKTIPATRPRSRHGPIGMRCPLGCAAFAVVCRRALDLSAAMGARNAAPAMQRNAASADKSRADGNEVAVTRPFHGIGSAPGVARECSPAYGSWRLLRPVSGAARRRRKVSLPPMRTPDRLRGRGELAGPAS